MTDFQISLEINATCGMLSYSDYQGWLIVRLKPIIRLLEWAYRGGALRGGLSKIIKEAKRFLVENLRKSLEFSNLAEKRRKCHRFYL